MKLTYALGRMNVAKSIMKMLVLTVSISSAMVITATSAQASPKYAGIVVDAKNGKVLYGADPDGLRYPASLTKMMTLYLTFEALEQGRIKLTSPVKVSANAAKEPPSKLGVRAGGILTVEQAIKALVTRSANDISTALAEFLGGSEERFARQMTAKARNLGMTRTTYRNAHGLPNTAQMTTARDQARLGIALRQHFPQYYGYFSTRSFQFGKQTIGNHNRLLGNVKGVDGIKTGYTRAAGSNLVTSAQLNDRSIVAVVMGGKSSAARDAQMRKLVAEFMPKASRGSTSSVIAQTRSVVIEEAAPTATEIAGLPLSGPIPNTRYDDSAASAFAPPARSAALESATRPHPNSAAPVPQEPVAVARAVIASPRDVDTIVTASTTRSPSADQAGWVIQIGASPDENSARGLLEAARAKGGKVLRSAEPFTVAFSKDGSQVYRARFGGFKNQDSAVNACKTLKKSGINCWASLQ
jgi:D-alanyl-D-alanine carboxypeptidase